MLRSDVQDKLVETLELIQAMIRLNGVPRVVISENGKKAAEQMRNALNASPMSADPVAPARRMWKRWAKVRGDGVLMSESVTSYKKEFNKNYEPVTILPGHDAVEQIENDAFSQGYREGVEACARTAKAPVFMGFENIACVIHGDNTITMVESDKVLIDGVEPVVVDAWTHDDYADKRSMPPYPWTEELGSRRLVASVWRRKDGACNTPCRVHLYPGVDSSGKKVG